MPRRPLLTVGLMFALCASPLLARNGIVRTKDGRSIDGDISDRGPEGVMIVTKGGSVSIAAGDVAGIDYASGIKEQYQQRVAALPKDAGAKAHLELARWLFDNKEYDLARGEADAAMVIEPNSSDANVLRQTIDRTAQLDRGGKPAPVGGGGVKPPVRTGSGGTTRPGNPQRDRKLLDADQINMLRQAELNLKYDEAVNTRLDKDVAKRFVDMQAIEMKDFTALKPGARAIKILQDGSPEMRADVKIMADPTALLHFKTKIEPVVLQGCATANCHDGSAGRFMLYTPAENDATHYTNFYILQHTEATVDGVKLKMIDRAQPQRSMLAQFGLPKDKAEFRHPEVANYRNIYTSQADTKYEGMTNWMRLALVPLEPKYGFTFAIPTGNAPATQPAGVKPAAEVRPAPAPVATPRGGEHAPTGNDAVDKTDEALLKIRRGNGGIRGSGI